MRTQKSLFLTLWNLKDLLEVKCYETTAQHKLVKIKRK